MERTLLARLECRNRLGPRLPHRSLSHGRPGPYIQLMVVIHAIKLMTCDKAAGTSLTVAEMLESLWCEGAQQIRDLIEDIVHFGKMLTEWEESIIVSLYKGCRPRLRKSLRPQMARPGHEDSREGGWELSKTTSAHRRHSVWLHAWMQHHRRHINCTPVTRKVYAIN